MASLEEKKRALEVALASVKKEFGDSFVDPNESVSVERISTGSFLLDDILGGGLPEGRIVEIFGEESSGKTSLITLVCAEAQKKHPDSYIGIVDVEHAFDPAYAEHLGLDTERLLFSQPESAEESLETVNAMTSSGACSVVVLDSVGGLQTKTQLEKGIGEATMGEVARIMSQGLPKIVKAASRTNTLVIFINQTRNKIVMYGNPNTTMGGKALKFFASVRLEIKKTNILTDSNGIPYGQTVKIDVRKNKVGQPFLFAETNLIFGKGFDRNSEVIDVAINRGIIEKKGAWFNFGEDRFHGKDKLVEYLNSDPETFESLVKMLEDDMGGSSDEV